MPSPFPGMDPYLEDPTLWPGFHHRFITYLSDALNAAMPERYVADIGERIFVVDSERDIFPDTSVFQGPNPHAAEQGDRRQASTQEAIDPPMVVTEEPLEVRELFIELRAVRPERRVVAFLEVVSPTNKYAGPGRELYRAKQREALRGRVHLVEIDLLRRGPHTVAAPARRIQARGHYDYLVSLHRAGEGGRYETWPFLIRQSLPRIAVPLADQDPDVPVDLQAVFARCYDEGAYRRQVDYRADPPDPLTPEDAAWADALLRERGLRPNPAGGAS